MKTKILCSKCKGRRIVFDPISIFLSVALPIALLMESDDDIDDNSLTKKRCPTCKGKGYLEF